MKGTKSLIRCHSNAPKAVSSVIKVLGVDPHLTIGFISHGFSVHCSFTFSQLSTHPPLCLLQRDKNEIKGRKKNPEGPEIQTHTVETASERLDSWCVF